MAQSVAISIPTEMCLAGNEILSEEFVLRWLCYHMGINEYVFDSDYCVNVIIMTGIDIAEVELSSTQHLLLGVNHYSVKTAIPM
jgi:hypothetical protein